ncbi:MAG: type II toxin-antitoxin system prevent-host-death family antitoxin [Armatimonadetes bacterium]|nr:type II toxin-antitoxin system prevent-host-death family antitoxin [Armatimonadota bacterium]
MGSQSCREAKTHLSRLLKEAVGGEEIVIARDGVPLVKLVPVAATRPRTILGLMKDVRMADDFDEPLDDFADYLVALRLRGR